MRSRVERVKSNADVKAPAEARPRVERIKSLKQMRTMPGTQDEAERGRPRMQRQQSELAGEAAAAVNDFVTEDIAKGNAEGYFTSFDTDYFVDTPGSARRSGSCTCSCCRSSLQAYVNVPGPRGSGICSSSSPSSSSNSHSTFQSAAAIRVRAAAQLLVAPALILRFILLALSVITS